MNTYKLGFALVSVKCANCYFDEHSIEPDFEKKSFALKEELFAEVIKLHDENIKIQKGIYKCAQGQLSIKF